LENILLPQEKKNANSYLIMTPNNRTCYKNLRSVHIKKIILGHKVKPIKKIKSITIHKDVI